MRLSIDWRVLAPAFVIAAGVCWGCIGLFSRVLSDAGLSSIQITFVRCSLTVLFLSAVFAVRNRSVFRIKPKDLWIFVGTGVLSVAFFNVCYFTCIRECGLSLAAILLYTSPCFVVVMSAIIFKERMTRRKVVALGLAFVGCLFVVGVVSGEMSVSAFGLLVGLGSGFGYALYSIFARIALKRYATFTVMIYTFLLASVALTPLADVGSIVTAASSSWIVLAAMFALACLSTLTPFALYTVGLAHMETGKAAIMAFVEPMVALVIGVTVFGDVLTPVNCAGIVLIVAAVVLLNVRFKQDAKRGLA